MQPNGPLIPTKTFLANGLENLSKPAAGTIQKIHYLTGGDGSLFTMYVIDQNNQGKMYYIYTDHTSTSLSTGLGSPNLITDAGCNVVQELSYDACCVKLGFCEHSETKPLVEPIPSLREGNRRDPATWQPYTSLASIPSSLIDRGFTFHSLPREERNGEHLYPFTLINMLSAAKSRSEAYAGKGRVGVYPERCNRFGNPLVGRFLSADPYIQAPDNPQNLNRYSYCLNNPLRYTDPSGEFIFSAIIPFGAFIDAACWGAVIGGAGYTASIAFSPGGFNNWDWGQFDKSIGFGAISGVATCGIGQTFGIVGSRGFAGELWRSIAHGYSQGMISALGGGNFVNGFFSGGLSSAAGSAFMIHGGAFAASNRGTYLFSTLAGGAGAALSGGNFWKGAAIGVMNAALNHVASMVDKDGARPFSNKKAAHKYCSDEAKNSRDLGNPRETNYYVLKGDGENETYVAPPWDQNTEHHSVNPYTYRDDSPYCSYYKGKRIIEQNHFDAHPPGDQSSSMGSTDDQNAANVLRCPVFHHTSDGRIYGYYTQGKGIYYRKIPSPAYGF